MNIMFASKANYNAWIYDRSNWEQTRKDLNIAEAIDHFEKNYKYFPAEYLYKPCLKQEDAEYRLEIMGEFRSRKKLCSDISEFCDGAGKLRALFRLFNEEKHEIQKQYRFLLSFWEYIENIIRLKSILSDVWSAGLRNLKNCCMEIAGSPATAAAYEIASGLMEGIGGMLKKTGIAINPREKTLALIECEKESETELLQREIFEAYGLGIKSGFSITSPLALSFLEEKVLGVLIEDNPETFEDLKNFHENHHRFAGDMREFIGFLPQFAFYTAYQDFAGYCEGKGIPLCRPAFDGGGFYAPGCAGIGLLLKFYGENMPLEKIVFNDIKLPKGKAFVLSGPNQGGKTIYLKALGATAYFAKCGCHVFCRECKIPFYDNICTHFAQKEALGKSRLAEELERIEKSAALFSHDTLVLLNESFTSTRRKDSVKIAVRYLKRFEDIGCSVGFVSHFYEIPEVYRGGKNEIISLQSGIAEGGKRTYKICEKSGGGLAYARDIALRCGMTYGQIIDEIRGVKK